MAVKTVYFNDSEYALSMVGHPVDTVLRRVVGQGLGGDEPVT
jgi:hypothetical protein